MQADEAKVEGRDEMKVAHSQDKTNIEHQDEKSFFNEFQNKKSVSPIENAKVESGPSHPASIAPSHGTPPAVQTDVLNAFVQFFQSSSQQVSFFVLNFISIF